MSRAKWKNPYIDTSLENLTQKNKKFFTMSRTSTILPKFVDNILYVHNGKTFIKIKITPIMVGRKLGEFVQTRKVFSFKKKN